MKYRKKPVVIDALEFSDENKDRVFHWVSCNRYADWDAETGEPILRIETLEGEMIARFGDFVVKGINGEFYPCKSEIFKKTYEPVTDN